MDPQCCRSPAPRPAPRAAPRPLVPPYHRTSPRGPAAPVELGGASCRCPYGCLSTWAHASHASAAVVLVAPIKELPAAASVELRVSEAVGSLVGAAVGAHVTCLVLNV